MRKAGCSVPIKYRHKDPLLGLDFFLKRVKAMQLGDTLAVDRALFDMYGKTVQTNSWGAKRYLTIDSQNMQNILALQVDCFGVEPLNRPVGLPFLGDGILTNDGALWKRSRELLNPIFARAQVSQLSTFETHVKRMIKLIPRDKSTIDLQPLFKMLFLDSSTEFIFGRSANSLSPETTSVVARRLPEVFDDALRAMQKRFMLGRKISYLTGNGKEFSRRCAETHAIIDSLIDEEIELQQSKAGKSPTMNDDSTYSYVLLGELVKNTHDKRFIRDQLMNVFFPGRDTAANLTGNVMFFLARRPQVWDKLRSEVTGIGSQILTFELLKSMKYLQGVINESKYTHLKDTPY
jgi:cytochrome P450